MSFYVSAFSPLQEKIISMFGLAKDNILEQLSAFKDKFTKMESDFVKVIFIYSFIYSIIHPQGEYILKVAISNSKIVLFN